jgi:hypothetical protein
VAFFGVVFFGAAFFGVAFFAVAFFGAAFFAVAFFLPLRVVLDFFTAIFFPEGRPASAGFAAPVGRVESTPTPRLLVVAIWRKYRDGPALRQAIPAPPA